MPTQADGTNITVQASVQAGGVWYVSDEMVIRVRDSIGSIITPPTTTSTPSTTPTEGDFIALIIDLLPYIVVAVVALIGAVCFKQRR